MSCAVGARTDPLPRGSGQERVHPLDPKMQVAHLGDMHLAEVLASEAKKFWGKSLPVIGGYSAAT